MSVNFQDNSIRVKSAIEEAAIAFLNEEGGEVAAQAARNTRVDTGQTKGSWDYQVDETALEALVGSPLQNAIWEELGTGEHALNGNGRKTPWAYRDEKGKWHKTSGKKPTRALFNAFNSLRAQIISRAESIFKGLGS